MTSALIYHELYRKIRGIIPDPFSYVDHLSESELNIWDRKEQEKRQNFSAFIRSISWNNPPIIFYLIDQEEARKDILKSRIDEGINQESGGFCVHKRLEFLIIIMGLLSHIGLHQSKHGSPKGIFSFYLMAGPKF